MIVSRPGLAREVASTAAVEMRPDRVAAAEVKRPAADRQADAAAAAHAAEVRRAEMQRFRS